jgi:hypothetical protein
MITRMIIRTAMIAITTTIMTTAIIMRMAMGIGPSRCLLVMPGTRVRSLAGPSTGLAPTIHVLLQ